MIINGKKHFSLTEYIGKDFKNINSNNQKEFKDLYFECEEVKYDDKTGRITRLVYKQIHKIE